MKRDCVLCGRSFAGSADHWLSLVEMQDDHAIGETRAFCSRICARKWLLAAEPHLDADVMWQANPDAVPEFTHTLVGVAPGTDPEGNGVVAIRALMGPQRTTYRCWPAVAHRMAASLVLAAEFAEGKLDSAEYDRQSDLLSPRES